MLPILTFGGLLVLAVAVASTAAHLTDRLDRLEAQRRAAARTDWDDREELAGRVMTLEALLTERIWDLEADLEDAHADAQKFRERIARDLTTEN
jgi:hypothetical protein